MDKLRKELAEIRADSVLDIATRDGAFAKELYYGLGACKKIIAVDISNKKFEDGKKKCEGLPIEFRLGDALELPFEDNTFDVVAIANSLHHIPDICKALSEAKRVVKPNGIIIVSEMFCDGQPIGSLTHWILHDLECYVDTLKGVYHHHTFSKRQIRHMIKNSGIIEQKIVIDKKTEIATISKLEKRALSAWESIEPLQHEKEFAVVHATYDWMIEEYKERGIASAEQIIIIGRKRE